MISCGQKDYNCPIEVTLGAMGGKWKCLVLWHLQDSIRRFAELRRLIPGITQKMLTQQLREMERDGLIIRKVYAEVPPRVEYSLSEHGETLRPILWAMCKWGVQHAKRIEATIVHEEPRLMPQQADIVAYLQGQAQQGA
ncbi:MAG: helix-turn-helix domain-containing protein [Thermodesulfobacteriota bacterium]